MAGRKDFQWRCGQVFDGLTSGIRPSVSSGVQFLLRLFPEMDYGNPLRQPSIANIRETDSRQEPGKLFREGKEADGFGEVGVSLARAGKDLADHRHNPERI